MKLLSLFKEEINAEDAHSEEGSYETVLNGQRDVGYIEIEKETIPDIEKQNLKIIPVRITSTGTIQSIIYREKGKENAIKLYKIAQSKDGYLKDNTPDEAREIGQLLNYSEESIGEYIWKRYHEKNVPSNNPDDYSDFH